MASNEKTRNVRLPNLIEALLPIVVMMGLMIYGLNFTDELYHDAHMPLAVSIVVACAVGCFCGHSFSDMLAGMIDRLNATMEAILILCTVGLLVASFIMSGTNRLRSAECDHPSAGSNGGLCNPQLFFTEHHTKGHFPEQTVKFADL